MRKIIAICCALYITSVLAIDADFSKSFVVPESSGVNTVTIGGIDAVDNSYSVNFGLRKDDLTLFIKYYSIQNSLGEKLEQKLRNTTWQGTYAINGINYTTTLNLVVVQDGYVGGEIIHYDEEGNSFLHVRVTGDIVTQFKINGVFVDEDRITQETLENLLEDTPNRQLIRIKRMRSLEFRKDTNLEWSANREYRLVLENETLSGTVGIPNEFIGTDDGVYDIGTIELIRQQNQRFLSFPLECGDKDCSVRYTQGAYTPNTVTSVLDHHLDTPYGYDGIVTAFTTERGVGEAKRAGCYPKDNGDVFSVNGLYKGTTDGNCLPHQGLNYDGHPGYDYTAKFVPVKAATFGTVVNIQNTATGRYGMCVPRGIDKSGGCAAWGFVGIDHGDGYIVQYGHLSEIYVKAGQWVYEGQIIGISGDTAPAPYELGPHLHFEVLKASPSAPYGYTFVDPYGWEGLPTDDYLANITGIPNIRLWK